MENRNKNMMPETKMPGIQHHEDAVLKISMQFFADELLLNLEQKQKVGEVITKEE